MQSKKASRLVFNQYTFLLVLFVVALLLRLGAVIALRDVTSGPGSEYGADGIEFNDLALRVARGHGYTWASGDPTSFRAPGFPFFLAGIYALVGESYPWAYLAFCILGALSCVLTYQLARELLSETLARQAGVLAAFYVPHIYFATVFSSESLFVPCLAVGMWWYLRHLKTGSLGLLLLGGLALGWGTLTRPFALLLLPLLLAVLVYHQWQHKRLRLAPVALFTVAFLGVVAPWTIRNYLVHGRPVLVATNGGSTFYGANNGRVVSEFKLYGGWVSTAELPGRELIEAMPDEVSHDRMEWKLGVEWVRENLADVPRLCVFKLVRLWLPEVDSANRKYVLLQLVGYTPMLVLYVLGLLYCLRRPQYRTAPWLAIHGAILATVVAALIFWGSPRFRDANLPLLMLYAALGMRLILARVSKRQIEPDVALSR